MKHDDEDRSMTVMNPRSSRWLRVALGLALAAVLAVGFLGYLTPSMRINWEAIASMCGF